MRRLTIVALLVGALMLAACGGQDKAGSRDHNTGAATYRAQLTRLCVDSSREAAQLKLQGANGAAFADFFGNLAAVLARREKQFDALRPPAGLRDEQSRLTRLLSAEVGMIEQAATDSRSSGDPVGASRKFATRYNSSLLERNKVFKQLKVPRCQEAQIGSGLTSPQGSS